MAKAQRDTLTIQYDIDKLLQRLQSLKAEKLSAPITRKFAQFQRSSRGEWYGPYFSDSFNRPREFDRLVAEYAWTAVMIYSIDADRVVQLASDMVVPIQSSDELHQVCRKLLKNPNRQ